MSKPLLTKQEKNYFLFIDETGISPDLRQKYFGLGAFKIKNTLYLNRKLHNIFVGALSFLKQREETFEFKFTYITKNSFRFYKEILNLLKNNSNWQFELFLKEKNKNWEKTMLWPEYLKGLDIILKKFPQDNIILVMDYLAKPKKAKNDILNITNKYPNVLNILQLESQGSLLLQVSDILLGGMSFQKRLKNGLKVDNLKLEISNLILNLLNKKEQF